MTWHLKNRELEKNLIELWPDFVTNLNSSVNSNIRDQNGYFVVSFANDLGSIGLSVSESYIRDVPPYNPKTWNDYPEVEPPEFIDMLLEFSDGYCTKAYFDGKEWYEIYEDRHLLCYRKKELIRYRQWED